MHFERNFKFRPIDEIVIGRHVLFHDVKFALCPIWIHYCELIGSTTRGRCFRFNIIKNSGRAGLAALIVLVVDVPILERGFEGV